MSDHEQTANATPYSNPQGESPQTPPFQTAADGQRSDPPAAGQAPGIPPSPPGSTPAHSGAGGYATPPPAMYAQMPPPNVQGGQAQPGMAVPPAPPAPTPAQSGAGVQAVPPSAAPFSQAVRRGVESFRLPPSSAGARQWVVYAVVSASGLAALGLLIWGVTLLSRHLTAMDWLTLLTGLTAVTLTAARLLHVNNKLNRDAAYQFGFIPPFYRQRYVAWRMGHAIHAALFPLLMGMQLMFAIAVIYRGMAVAGGGGSLVAVYGMLSAVTALFSSLYQPQLLARRYKERFLSAEMAMHRFELHQLNVGDQPQLLVHQEALEALMLAFEAAEASGKVA